MGRNILSVVGGFLVWTVCWLGFNSIISMAMPDQFNADGTTDSVGMFLTFLVASALISVLSGWVLPKLAKRSDTRLAWILGGILFAVGLLVQIGFWDAFPVWYHLLFLGLLIPATLFGHSLSKQETVAA